ncbi:MAG: nicotinate (nicotinamide) nucleotide adenylyltransferase [Pirellulales bacterium]|nr:nicotinate (nicotinamide) nucleotide adenylyltransferase [Pirellulales bacterium]
MRLGIFGGSFDPVHYGHLLLAESCREQCRLDAVWFVPAAVPPHKQDRKLSSDADRVEMLKLAIGGHEAFAVYPWEIDRGGVSYTVETLQQLRAEDSSRELFLLMGADSLADLPTWREPERICSLAIPIVVRRNGSPQPNDSVLAKLMSPERLAVARNCAVESPLIDLHSTELRQRVSMGKSIRFRTPRAVEKYIHSRGLYQVV